MPRRQPITALLGIFLTVQNFFPQIITSVDINLRKIERVSTNEASFQIEVANRAARPAFFAGINYKSGPILFPIYLEHWEDDAWKIVVPCLDAPPPDVIRLTSGEVKFSDLILTIPLRGTCKKRNIDLVGKFRFRVAYFDSQTQAHNYIQHLFDDNQRPPNQIATSKIFEIPPSRN